MALTCSDEADSVIINDLLKCWYDYSAKRAEVAESDDLITHAFLFKLDDGDLLLGKGMDDADKARWINPFV